MGQNPFKDRQEETSVWVSILLDADVPTNTRSSSVNLDVLRNYVQRRNARLLIDNYALLNLFGQALSVNPNAPVQNSLEEFILTSTSTVPVLSFIGLNDFPVQIKEYLDELHASEKDEDSLYEVAEAIVEWLTDNSDEYQTSLAVELQNMPSTARRILIAALSDAEAQVNNRNLLDTIGLFLESTDKLLAQSSAACILTCGGVLGKNILQSKLSTKDLPHSQLIQGIMRLFS